MIKVICSIIVVIAVFVYGFTFAAPNSQVTVVNTSSNPVPVTSTKKARQLLPVQQISTTAGESWHHFVFTPSPIDVSGCESIRFALKLSENPCLGFGVCYNSCVLSDQSFAVNPYTGIGYILVEFSDFSAATTQCKSWGTECEALIQNPGTSQLLVSCDFDTLPNDTLTLSAALYCW